MRADSRRGRLDLLLHLRFSRPLLWLLVTVGFVAALASGVNRWRIERTNRTVEIALDYAELRALSSSSGISRVALLKRFRRAGATSIVLVEETIGGLEQNKRLTGTPTDRDHTTLVFKDTDLQARVIESVRSRHGWPVVTTGLAITVARPYSALLGVAVGLDPATVKEAQQAGLFIVGRIANWPGATDAQREAALKALKAQGVRTILFQGTNCWGTRIAW